jgi:enoyl-CoA hydratase
VAPGEALSAALALAAELSAFPQVCMRNDRLSSLAQWSLDWDAACRHEADLGAASLRTGASRAGAQAFTAGAGRHGGARSDAVAAIDVSPDPPLDAR